MIQNFEKLDAELLEKFKSKSGVKIRGLVSTFDIKLSVWFMGVRREA